MHVITERYVLNSEQHLSSIYSILICRAILYLTEPIMWRSNTRQVMNARTGDKVTIAAERVIIM